MLTRFKNHLSESFSFLKDQKLLLALSGGLDSMVLWHLLQALDFKIGLAHGNFQLRAQESEGDFEFVKQKALELQLPFYMQRFDTANYAEEKGISIQMAARELRYTWFEELRISEGYDWILTAHHADDHLETTLINLTRGTGLDGLLGIPAISGKIVRPLLPFSREQILAYAQKHEIIWREDSSNASTKYFRNKIRHQVIPVLKELNPTLLTSFQQTLSYLKESQDIIHHAIQELKNQVVEEKENHVKIHLEPLKKLPSPKAYLYPLLQSYGFTSWDDIYNLMDAQSGKQIFSDQYQLIKDRNCFLIQPLTVNDRNQSYVWENLNEVLSLPIHLESQIVEQLGEGNQTSIFVDADKIQSSLVIRKWQEGDVFYPLGMKGQKKKVSKFFKDEKMSLLEKEAIWLLCSDEKIVWIMGRRADERFKVSSQSTKILNIIWHE